MTSGALPPTWLSRIVHPVGRAALGVAPPSRGTDQHPADLVAAELNTLWGEPERRRTHPAFGPCRACVPDAVG
jgi:hypothetical protein